MASPKWQLDPSGHLVPVPKHVGPLGWALHEAGQTGEDLVNAVYNSIPGFYHLTGGLIHHPGDTLKTVAEGFKEDFQHPLRHPGYTALDLTALLGGAGALETRLASLGRMGEVGAGTASRVSARAAEPGMNLLKATREAGIGDWSVSPTGEPVPITRQITNSLILGQEVPDRVLRVSGKEVRGFTFSRNPNIRRMQQLLDQLHERWPEGSFIPPWRSQASRISSAEKSMASVKRAELRAEGARLLQRWRGVPLTWHDATKMVARGIQPDRWIPFLNDRLQSGELNGRQTNEILSQLSRAPEALKLVEPWTHTNPETGAATILSKLRDDLPISGDLHQFRGDVEKLSRARTDALKSGGWLSSESEVRRILAAKNITEGFELPQNISAMEEKLQRLLDKGRGETPTAKNYVTKIAAAKVKLENGRAYDDELLTRPLEEGGGGLFRVPDTVKLGSRVVEGFTRPWRGGKPQTPGTLTHEFTGAIFRGGGGNPNLAEVMAESYIEAARFMALRNFREDLLASAQDTPEGIPSQWVLPIREEWFKGQVPREWAGAGGELLNKEGDLSQNDLAVGGLWFEPIRNFIFGESQSRTAIRKGDGTNWRNRLRLIQQRAMHPNEAEWHGDPIPGVKFVDRRLLGGLDKQNPLWSAMDNPGFRAALRGIDALNTTQKMALLYLKPAYLLPNALGNVALAFVHQGFLAPSNLFKAVKAVRGYDPETVATIRQVTGGGFSASMKGRANYSQVVTELGNRMADLYGKVIDDPFRFAAFIHEARAKGFVTAREMRELTQNPKYEADLREAAVRANDALIAYERLSPGEQTILRRLVFFYPWVKGAARYATRLPAEHPVVAGAHAQASKQGEELVNRIIGTSFGGNVVGTPSYAKGIFPITEGSGFKMPGYGTMPLTVNPASFSILQPFGELLDQGLNLTRSPPLQNVGAFQSLAPVDTALLDILTSGRTSFGKNQTGHSPLWNATHDLFGGNPLKRFISDEINPAANPRSVYQENDRITALLRFALLGGLTPRPYNVPKGVYSAFNEQNPR